MSQVRRLNMIQERAILVRAGLGKSPGSDPRSKRKHFGMNQSRFAGLLGCNQGYVSDWERGRREVSVDRFEFLGEILLDPLAHEDFVDSRDPEGKKISVDPDSPILRLPLTERKDAFAKVFVSFGDIRLSNEEWKGRFEGLGWPLSDAPFALSKSLRAYNAQKESPLSHYFLPTKSDIEFDREVHGDHFVQYLLELFGSYPEAPQRKGWEDVSYASRYLAETLKRLPGCPKDVLPATWRDRGIAQLAVMDFLAIVYQATGFDEAAVTALSERATAWIQRKKRNAEALKGFDAAASSHVELAQYRKETLKHNGKEEQ